MARTAKDDFDRPVIYRGIKIEPPIGRKRSPLAKAIREALRADAQDRPENEPMKVYRIEHDGFEGVVIGTYKTLEGKEGVVLQQVGTRVVHVYARRWLTEKGGDHGDDR